MNIWGNRESKLSFIGLLLFTPLEVPQEVSKSFKDWKINRRSVFEQSVPSGGSQHILRSAVAWTINNWKNFGMIWKAPAELLTQQYLCNSNATCLNFPSSSVGSIFMWLNFKCRLNLTFLLGVVLYKLWIDNKILMSSWCAVQYFCRDLSAASGLTITLSEWMGSLRWILKNEF